MKYVFIALALISANCATTDPYQGCYGYQDETVKNNCIQQVRQYQMQMWAMRSQQVQQSFQPQQQQPVYQMPINKPIQTNCSRIGNQTFCQSY